MTIRAPDSSASLFDERFAAAHERAAHGAYREAITLLDEALRLCPADDIGRRAQALASLAHNYPRLGNLQASARCANEAVALCEKQDDAVLLADALTSLSYVYAQLLMASDALDYGLRALAAARRGRSPLRKGWALNRLGVAYSSLENPAQACEATQKALDVACNIDDEISHQLRFSCLNNLAYFWLRRTADARRDGHTAILQQALTQSQQLSEQATQMARASSSPFQVAVSVSNLVEALLNQGAYEAAAPLLSEFEHLSATHGYSALGLQAATHRALICKAHGDFVGAQTGLRALLEEPSHGELPPKQRRILIRALYETHKAAGDYQEALQYLEQHADLERLIWRETLAMQTEVMQIRQDVAQAQAKAEYAALDAMRERERASQLEHEQQRLREHAAELDRAAHEDVLTGLHNRRHTEFALPLLLEGTRLAGQQISMALLDVDHFKLVNDTFGHGIGDQVLRQVAELLREKMRSADLLARFGGEEFLVVLVGMAPAQAFEICERLRVAVSQHDWSRLAKDLQVRISIGLAGGSPAVESDVLLERADLALYAAKRGGRDRVHVDASR